MKYFPTILYLLNRTSGFTDIIDSVLLICRSPFMENWEISPVLSSRTIRAKFRSQTQSTRVRSGHVTEKFVQTTRAKCSCVAVKVDGLASLTCCTLFILSPGPVECATEVGLQRQAGEARVNSVYFNPRNKRSLWSK